VYRSTDVALFFKHAVSSFSVEKWNTCPMYLLDFVSDLIVGYKYFAEKYINDNLATAIKPRNIIYFYYFYCIIILSLIIYY